MKNKKGFISISIIYSFFIVFMLFLVLIMSTYVNNRFNFNLYKNDIKKRLIQEKELVDNPVVPEEPIPSISLSEYLVQQSSNSIKSSSFNGSLYYLKSDSFNNYRYRGVNPDNYLSFDNKTWRIIGTFSGKNIGGDNNSYYTKIIYTETYQSTNFAPRVTSNWKSSNAYNAVSQLYSYITNTNYIYNASWYFARIPRTSGINSSTVYKTEKMSSLTNSYFGIPSLSDYLFASFNESTISGVGYNNWLNNYEGYLLNYYNNYAWVNYRSTPKILNMQSTLKVYLVVYLKNDVIYTDGDGSINNPYTISY